MLDSALEKNLKLLWSIELNFLAIPLRFYVLRLKYQHIIVAIECFLTFAHL